VLTDGNLPSDSDQPGANFFFAQGTDGGRLLVDLGKAIEIKQINTYSWHRNTRAPQVYSVYASEGKDEGFDAQVKRPDDPAKSGWKLLGEVDTRTQHKVEGGQYGVSITETSGSLGSARYLLFDVRRTESEDSFGNTFLSEIDVIDKNAPEQEEPALVESVAIEGTPYRFTVDTNEAPDLTEWATKVMIPVMKEWYPKIVKMLPSENFEAPRTFSITFTNSYRGVAATAGNRIMCSPSWYRSNLKGEALGSLVHELVHVVQQYSRRRGGARPPGWLIEGIPDYIRWYLYEPESRGAEISPRNVSRTKYDGSYRVSANFLNYVTGKYDKELIAKLNAAMREGRYDAAIWKEATGKTVEELGEEWKASLAPAQSASAPAGQ
jgi:hypothetical protein